MDREKTFWLNAICFVFFLGALLDFTTSFIGILGVFGFEKPSFTTADQVAVCFLAFIMSGIILVFASSSSKIWSNGVGSNVENGSFKDITLKCFHVGAIFYDAYTSFIGSSQLFLLSKSRADHMPDMSFSLILHETSIEQKTIIAFLTFFLVFSPVALGELYPSLGDSGTSSDTAS